MEAYRLAAQLPLVVLRARPLDPDVVAANALTAEVQLVDMFASACKSGLLSESVRVCQSQSQTFVTSLPDPRHLNKKRKDTETK